MRRQGQKRWRIWRVLLLVAAGFVSPVSADELTRFLDEVDSLSGRFEQRQFDEDGEVLTRAAGSFWILRPNRFHWAYAEPYEQFVVSDGDTVWIHDPDLEQVTRRAARDALDGTPAALLSRDRRALEAFEIERLSDGAGANATGWRLRPRADDGDFREIRLWLRDATPTRIEFNDQLGGTTRIDLIEVERNRQLPAGKFRFVVPDGAEVVEG